MTRHHADDSTGSEVDEAEVLDLLADLVRTPSVNPSLDATGTGEAAVAAAVVAWATAMDLDVMEVGADPARPNVLVSSRAEAGDGPTIVVCGHLDTVGTDGRPIDARREGDRLYGRGAYDMKAGLVAALFACREAARRGLAARVVVAAVADEEHASLGMQEVLDHLDPASIDAAIVTEPTELVVAIAHKGFVWARIEVAGVAAHGSRPELGRDAIMGLGPILTHLAALDRELATRPHPLLGPGSVHASKVAGGRDWATIPEHATLDVERRTLPGESVAVVERDLQRVLDRARHDDPDLEATVETVLVREPLHTPADDFLVTAVQGGADDVMGRSGTPGGVSYWADAAMLSAAGIPTVLFGPDGDGAHAEVEWVSIAGTMTTIDVLVAATARLGAIRAA